MNNVLDGTLPMDSQVSIQPWESLQISEISNTGLTSIRTNQTSSSNSKASQSNLFKNGEPLVTSFLYSGNINNDDLDCLDDLDI